MPKCCKPQYFLDNFYLQGINIDVLDLWFFDQTLSHRSSVVCRRGRIAGINKMWRGTSALSEWSNNEQMSFLLFTIEHKFQQNSDWFSSQILYFISFSGWGELARLKNSSRVGEDYELHINHPMIPRCPGQFTPLLSHQSSHFYDILINTKTLKELLDIGILN